MVTWRDTSSVDDLIRAESPCNVTVLAGNGSWLARQALATARDGGYRVGANLPSESRGAGPPRVTSWAELGRSAGALMGVTAAVAALEPAAVPFVAAAGVASHLAQPAIEWLQSRLADTTHTDSDGLVGALAQLRLAVVDHDAAGPRNSAHILELVDRRTSGDPAAALVVVLDEPIVQADITDAHDLALPGWRAGLQRVARRGR